MKLKEQLLKLLKLPLENDENDDITCHLFSRYKSFEDFDMLVAGLIFSLFEAFKM